MKALGYHGHNLCSLLASIRATMYYSILAPDPCYAQWDNVISITKAESDKNIGKPKRCR